MKNGLFFFFFSYSSVNLFSTTFLFYNFIHEFLFFFVFVIFVNSLVCCSDKKLGVKYPLFVMSVCRQFYRFNEQIKSVVYAFGISAVVFSKRICCPSSLSVGQWVTALMLHALGAWATVAIESVAVSLSHNNNLWRI